LKEQQRLQRPRSRHAHDKVIEAAIELFAERGIEGTSVDSIAALSGVSKATIYKHWEDKHALCLETLAKLHGLDRTLGDFDSGDLLADMIEFLAHRPPEELSARREKLMPHLIAYAARNPEFGIAWRTKALQPRQQKAIELLKRGKAEGVFPPELDPAIGVALLLGPMMYRHFYSGTTPENLPEEVAKAFWRAYAKPASDKSH
jgi:AcrR family transcriptional regulator